MIIEKTLPDPIPQYCCGRQLNPCSKCGADVWKSIGDRDCGDWDEEVFECQHCKNRIHIELPG
jgi:hypothetical protein